MDVEMWGEAKKKSWTRWGLERQKEKSRGKKLIGEGLAGVKTKVCG